jgi:hypothetical protein
LKSFIASSRRIVRVLGDPRGRDTVAEPTDIFASFFGSTAPRMPASTAERRHAESHGRRYISPAWTVR